jgi:hypothetical protein
METLREPLTCEGCETDVASLVRVQSPAGPAFNLCGTCVRRIERNHFREFDKADPRAEKNLRREEVTETEGRADWGSGYELVTTQLNENHLRHRFKFRTPNAQRFHSKADKRAAMERLFAQIQRHNLKR